MKRLTGRKILITGAGSGIGLAATHLFIEEGANVAALDLDTRNAKRAVQPTRGIAIDVDVSDESPLTDGHRGLQVCPTFE